MVKPITQIVKLLVLGMLILLLSLSIWLHTGKRSFDFLKPWIVASLNPADSPIEVRMGEVSIDWQDVTRLGMLRISDVSFAKRGGEAFAELPEIYATIDLLGWLPARRMLHQVSLHAPQIYMTRNAAGTVMMGIENSTSTMPLAALFASVATDKVAGGNSAASLPFSELKVTNAELRFSDEATQTVMLSSPMSFELAREKGEYDANLAMPFSYEDDKGQLDAVLKTTPGSPEHLLSINLTRVPIKLLCAFGMCPDGIEGTGRINGSVGLRIADDGTLKGVRVNITTKKAVISALEWFEEPLKLTDSAIIAESDVDEHAIHLNSVTLGLEDTNITAKGVITHKPEGWYVDAEGEAGRLDITKVYKYWPIIMAPDSRLWVTSKLKSGYAEKGTIKLKLTPEDFAADAVSDAAVDAWAYARDIRFEYLPGFPEVEGMNGDVHFTGRTARIEGGGGRMLTGTEIPKAMLWCPELHNPRNPMETTLTTIAPAGDAVTLLALPHFVFEDAAKLDASKITGTVEASMSLKFNAFSEHPSKDPNALHLDAVDYDITATLMEVAQPGVYGGYDVRAANGTVTATTQNLGFIGSLALGDTGVADVTVSQPSGKPLTATVKTRNVQPGKANNDFALTYSSGVVPGITVTGKRLDASQVYSTSEHSLLKDFPAMKLNVTLGELILSSALPFTNVSGTMDCGIRCESLSMRAKIGGSPVNAAIDYVAGRRQFQLTAKNAGLFLKGMDISDRVTGGSLELKGMYDDSKTPAPLDARLLLEDFTLRNSQILGRILSVGSLTGLTNLLTGNGIAFEKLAANINARAGVIAVSKGRANGNAMGLTVEGKVDTTKSALDLKGVVIPAYALNSILSEIPIIGTLAGGEGGLIAVNYSVRGPYADPSVMVNPLSILTPGVLRGVFGVFDAEEDAADSSSGQVAPAPSGTQTPNPGSRNYRK